MKNKKLIFTVLIVTVLAAVLFVLLKNESTDDAPSTTGNTDSDSRTTSSAPTAQDDFTDGTDRDPGNSLREDEGRGIIEDSSGTDNSSLDKSNSTTSESGEITVYSPAKNSLLETGDLLSGESTLSTVNFRLIDNYSGVIAQGELSVVNGKFSGKFNFTTNATEGRLDIFSTKNEGVEFNNIEIPIRFK